jgi:crotonobetainyl-CoA:carnitine CoA-transferase CaiB-like acyl-CoA transferase
MAAMVLADLGATVLRIERRHPAELGLKRPLQFDLLLRNRQVIALDLKNEEEKALALRLIQQADGLIEGFRPGVAERMGLGPDVCQKLNPRLVYGRITGWGQTGPLAHAAGHDLNYVALTGILDKIGRKGQPPTVPLNLVGDFGGGGLYLAVGMLAGILEARQSGQGQVVDAAVVDGTVSLAASTIGMHGAGMLSAERGTNTLDSGAYFYDVYPCADEKWVSIAAIEGKFHGELLRHLGIDPKQFPNQHDRTGWDRARTIIGERLATRTRDEWCKLFEGTDACFAPVLTLDEAAEHPHLKARNTFITVDGVKQPAPAPRFSRTPASTPRSPVPPGKQEALATLETWLGAEERERWRHLV